MKKDYMLEVVMIENVMLMLKNDIDRDIVRIRP